MIKKELIKNLKKVIEKIGINDILPDLECPANKIFGDYSSSVALKLAKILKKNPLETAQIIIGNFPGCSFIEKTEIVKPGFINFWLTKKFLLSQLKENALANFNFAPVNLGKEKKIMVEFAHPNTHKLFHIGHLRNIATGESLVRILEASGNKVIRANYQGDVGLHIAKCLYKVKSQKSKVKSLKTIKEKIDFIGKMYTEGTRAYEDDPKAKKEIIKINKMIYDHHPEIVPLWQETRQWSLEYFNNIYKRVYSHFNRFYFESEMAKRGVEIVNQALEKGLLEKSNQAVVFNGKKYGLDTRVFINSLGFPTYEGKELALAEKEFSEFGEIDKCIHVVTPEQTSFFKVTFKVEELLDEKKYKNKQYHLAYEWVKLKEGKMSSREGNIIEANWLIDEAGKKIKKLFACPNDIAETLAVASVKYSFLKNGVTNPIFFDFDESISLEGNSGPYLLYTYVRTQSVIKKSKNNNLTIKPSDNQTVEKEELSLLRLLYQFPEIVEKAAKNFAPNYIATYLFQLAQEFNLFYQKFPILKAEKNKQNFRLLLTKATGQILKKGLFLLGIETVQQM